MQLMDGVVPDVFDERIYTAKALVMSQNMDRTNAAGFFNYFESVTVKNNAKLFMTIAAIFQDEVQSIKGVAGLQVYIVYNPLTVSTSEKMERHGGNALGIRPKDGLLNSKPSTAPREIHKLLTFFSRQHQSALDRRPGYRKNERVHATADRSFQGGGRSDGHASSVLVPEPHVRGAKRLCRILRGKSRTVETRPTRF